MFPGNCSILSVGAGQENIHNMVRTVRKKHENVKIAVFRRKQVVGPRLIDGRGYWGVLGGADNVLGCPPYKIFSWTCCYAIHSSLAPYPGTRYQVLLVTCKTLLIFALLFLGGGFGGFWGGLIAFLAARLTRYSLGLAATLSTLLLHRTLAHAIKSFL